MHNLAKYVGVVAVTASTLLIAPGAQAGPRNDSYDHPQALGRVPATVVGTTEGATRGKDEPGPWCAPVRGVVWYRVRAPRRGPMVARVKAEERLDAAVAAYSIARSQRERLYMRPDRCTRPSRDVLVRTRRTLVFDRGSPSRRLAG
jgi:hypothetical protein